MEKYYAQEVAENEAMGCAKQFGGTWGVIKYPHDYGVEKLTAFIRTGGVDIVFTTPYREGGAKL